MCGKSIPANVLQGVSRLQRVASHKISPEKYNTFTNTKEVAINESAKSHRHAQVSPSREGGSLHLSPLPFSQCVGLTL